MIFELAASAMLTSTPVSTPGSSEEARFVHEQTQLGRNLLLQSVSFGTKTKEALESLYDVLDGGQTRGWDGYDALPVSQDSYSYAYRLIENLPLGAPTPSISADPDGHVSLEWYRSPRRLLSVSVSAEGELHFAALIGTSRIHGVEPFSTELPKTIADLISRVCPI